jgi:hypothetical protein
MNWPLILTILVVWTLLGFVAWSFLTVGHEYREPITEDEIRKLRREADRVVLMGDQWPADLSAERRGYVPTRARDFKAVHSTHIASGAQRNHGL